MNQRRSDTYRRLASLEPGLGLVLLFIFGESIQLFHLLNTDCGILARHQDDLVARGAITHLRADCERLGIIIREPVTVRNVSSEGYRLSSRPQLTDIYEWNRHAEIKGMPSRERRQWPSRPVRLGDSDYLSGRIHGIGRFVDNCIGGASRRNPSCVTERDCQALMAWVNGGRANHEVSSFRKVKREISSVGGALCGIGTLFSSIELKIGNESANYRYDHQSAGKTGDNDIGVRLPLLKTKQKLMVVFLAAAFFGFLTLRSLSGSWQYASFGWRNFSSAFLWYVVGQVVMYFLAGWIYRDF